MTPLSIHFYRLNYDEIDKFFIFVVDLDISVTNVNIAITGRKIYISGR
jgi:hypothetical protein